MGVHATGNSQPEWVYAIAYATPALHVFGVAMHYLISRLERISSLIEYVIEIKENSLINQSTSRLPAPDSLRCAPAAGY